MIYYGIIKDRSKANDISIKAVILFMVIIEIFARKFTYVPITLFLLGASFLKKSHIVSHEGVNIQYEWLGKSLDTLWSWESITGVAYDDQKMAPNLYFYFGKGMTTRAFVIEASDFKGIMDLVKDHKPGMIIENISKN